MNLLRSAWIPVQRPAGGQSKKLTLQELLCSDEKWALSLPRDDLEFAALQLLICIVQVLFPPNDKAALEKQIRAPMQEKVYEDGIQPMTDWFGLDHPDFPFLQVKDVNANSPTTLDKLLAGLDTATNSRFVNEPGLADKLCGGCAAIALYNQANNAPSFGGGFKFGLRGTCPTSTLIQSCLPGYNDLRATIWFNILTSETLKKEFSLVKPVACNDPTWVTPISSQDPVKWYEIGLLRGLFWQPNHVELINSDESGNCCLCGCEAENLIPGFKKAKFTYTVEGLWPHPHSPRIIQATRGRIIDQFFRYTTSAPSWTQLSRFIVKKNIGDGQKEGHRPAAVVLQAKTHWRHLNSRLVFIAGGYRNNQASIIERRHDILALNSGWQEHTDVIEELVNLGLGFRAALDAALKTFCGGIKGKDRKTKGIGAPIYKTGEQQFYRQTENLMLDTFSRIDFSAAQSVMCSLKDTLSRQCRLIFENLTEPYVHDPEFLRTRVIARRVLEKRLKEIKA